MPVVFIAVTGAGKITKHNNKWIYLKERKKVLGSKSQVDNCSSCRTQLLESSLRPKKWTTSVQVFLHWLPVHQRIDFKVLMLVYKAPNGLAPKYISYLLTHYEPSRPLRFFYQFPESEPNMEKLHSASMLHMSATNSQKASDQLKHSVYLSPSWRYIYFQLNSNKAPNKLEFQNVIIF